MSNIELLRNLEGLRLLLSDVEDLAGQCGTDAAQIGRHLELQNAVLVVLQLQIFEVLGDRNIIYVGDGSQCHFDVLEQAERSLARIYLKCGLNQKCGFISDQNTLSVDVHPGIELVVFSLPLEVTELRKALVK